MPCELRWAVFLKSPGSFHPVLHRTQENRGSRLHFQALFGRQFEAAHDGLFSRFDGQRGARQERLRQCIDGLRQLLVWHDSFDGT
jgi:hypothetical protein